MTGTGTGTATDPGGGSVWVSSGGHQSPNNGYTGLKQQGSLNVSVSVTIGSGGSSTPLPTLSNALIYNKQIKY